LYIGYPGIVAFGFIKNSVSNLLKTSFGERLFQPQLGSSLRSLLFEPMDQFSSTEIKDRVFDTLTNYEPRIENIIDQTITDALASRLSENPVLLYGRKNKKTQFV
jgi:phage baseplate assembly protein W